MKIVIVLDVPQRYLETIVPKTKGSVMIVCSGDKKMVGQTGKVLERQAEVAVVQLDCDYSIHVCFFLIRKELNSFFRDFILMTFVNLLTFESKERENTRSEIETTPIQILVKCYRKYRLILAEFQS